MIVDTQSRGAMLAERLGLPIIGRDGHNLKAACVACDSSDAFRIHADDGVAFCHSCQAKFSRLELATKLLGNQPDAWRLLEEIGLEQPRANGNGRHNGHAAPNILEAIAREKSVTPEALAAFGAKVEGGAVVVPMYGPDGQQCSSFAMKPGNGKGVNAKGRPSGLFFPHEAGNVRLPKPGETWHCPEGVKDAAALHSLGLLACGLPSSSMAAKFCGLFVGVAIVAVPDLDAAGKTGAEKSAKRLYGLAASVRIARLPGEFADSKGADARDALKQPGGREAVLKALADATEWKPQTAADDKGGLWEPEGRTDIANARRLVAMHGQNFRWCEPWTKWIVWDGKRWQTDAECRMAALGKTAADATWREIAEIVPKAERELLAALTAFGKRTASANGLRDMQIVARSEAGVPILPELLDRDPWLLNLENGTLDLRTAELRPHRREDFITKLAPVAYDPDAECPLWRGTLKRIMAGNDDLIAFLRRFAGYSLAGVIREHAIAFLFGTGANGKSTFLNTLLALLGRDYAMKAAPELLMLKRGESHPTERADLAGKRFVACIETEDGRRLAEALVKELTGGDNIRARRMREDFWEFPPTHTIWLAANHKPIIRGTDLGIWRRIKMLPFNVAIPDAEQDGALPDKLLGELPGILNWAILGCIEWQADGLSEPDEVKAATGKYRGEMDLLAKFLGDCCIVAPTLTTRAGDLYAAYRKWCEASGETPISGTRFGTGITERGFEKRKSGVFHYFGIGLASNRQEELI